MAVKHADDNTIASVMVPHGYSVRLYVDDGLPSAGDSITIAGLPYLDASTNEMQCMDLPG